MIDAIAGRRPAEAEQVTRRHLRSVITALLDQPQPGTNSAAARVGPSSLSTAR